MKFIEYWDNRLFAYYIEDVLVKWGEHAYGRPPYWETEATILSTHDPDDEGIGYAAPLVPIVEALNSFVTIQMNWAYLNGFPTAKITTTDPMALEVTDKEITFIPGVGYQAPPGYDVNWMNVPPVGGDLTQMRDFFKAEGNQVSLAPILFGMLGQDVSNATASTMIAVAKSIFGPGLQGIQDMFNGIAAFMQEQIERELREPVPIWTTSGDKSEWLELGPDDIDGYYEVEHTLEPVIPVEEMQRALYWGQMFQNKLASRREAIELGRGAHDPERVIEEIALEDMEAREDVQGYITSRVLKRIGKKEEPAALGQGTPANLPIGMGGPGAVTTPGVQSPLIPGEQGQIVQPAVGPGGAGIGRG